KYLERQAIKSRYPLFTNPEKPIWIPSQEYNEHDANDAFKKAKHYFKKYNSVFKRKAQYLI
ncbi:MAG TPA: hypothetical protein VF360_00485, partial [Candidatus Methanoperedens sp.]